MKSQLINIIEAHICIASNRSASSSYIKEVPQHDPSLRSEYGFRVKLKTVYFILPVLYSHHTSPSSVSAVTLRQSGIVSFAAASE